MNAFDTIVIAASPNSGSGARRWVIDELQHRLSNMGYQALVCREISQIERTVGELTEQQRLRCVVAAGGDGTLALMSRLSPPNTPILPVPLGTENLLARQFGHPFEPIKVANAIRQMRTRTIDAWTANGTLFLIMVSAGVDANVTQEMHRTRQGHIRHWSYLKPILTSLRTYQYPEIDVYCDGEPVPISVGWTLAFNIPQYALGIRWVRNAMPDDGKLEVCLLKRSGLLAGLRYLSSAAMGTLASVADVSLRSVNELELHSKEPVPFQLDGDFAGMLPVSIKKRPAALTLLMPAENGAV